MATLSNVSASFVTARNSNNRTNDNAIFTQYRRHCFEITMPSEAFVKYSGKDVESAIFGFSQTRLHAEKVTNNTYWVFYNDGDTCPFGTGTTESVTTDASAYPTTESEQCVTRLTTSTSEIISFSVDIARLIAYALDSVSVSSGNTTSFYIWQRFGKSDTGSANGSTTNIGDWTLTVTMQDGTTFVYTDGEWKASKVFSVRTASEWKDGEAGVYRNGAW